MGFGGNLIWTSVFKVLHEQDGKPVTAITMPLLSDLLAGRIYNLSNNLADDSIFRGNPRLKFMENQQKSFSARILDSVFIQFLRIPGLRHRYEGYIHRKSQALYEKTNDRFIHVDMRIYSYAERTLRDKIIWKPQARAADAILASFADGPASLDCELYFSDEEAEEVRRLMKNENLEAPFIILEPDTNRDYFGELRGWPFDRWQEFADNLSEKFATLQIVQVGLPSSRLLSGVVDLRGKTSFRTASLLLKSADLFVGTESGLMHAANAVGAHALILWGGITLPEFAGYPERQKTICKYVACAPCGLHGQCTNGHICMRNIDVESVTAAACELLMHKDEDS